MSDGRRHNGGRRQNGLQVAYADSDKSSYKLRKDEWQPRVDGVGGVTKVRRQVPAMEAGTQCQVSAWGKWTKAEATGRLGEFWLPAPWKLHVYPPDARMVRL